MNYRHRAKIEDRQTRKSIEDFQRITAILNGLVDQPSSSANPGESGITPRNDRKFTEFIGRIAAPLGILKPRG